jgi:hypothetical protein
MEALQVKMATPDARIFSPRRSFIGPKKRGDAHGLSVFAP